MNANELLSQLRKFVLIKSGLRNIDPGHCKTISEYVFQDTKNYVSETTIKRFFGFANTLHKFSLFTLNSLSQYIGYPDWEAFCSDKENQNYSVENVWEDLKLRCQAVTEVSLVAKKNNSGVPFSFTAKRALIYPDFDYFLKNNYQFTSITAQPGHGKSILLAHLVEHFFFSESALYKKDIVLLVNSMIIRTIIQNGLSLKDWFQQEFKVGSLNELINYFNKNKDKREGRFVLIIDGLDEYLAKSNYFKIFVDFLYSIEENNFVKIVMGLRTTSWINLQPSILGSAFLTRSWYKGLFVNTEDQSNIPFLNREEILATLSKIEGEHLKPDLISPEIFNLFKVPFWIQIYYALKQENVSLDLENPANYYELIHYFLEKKVFLAKQSTEKIFLLKKIANSTTIGNKGHRVAKEQILDFIISYPEAYQELLWAGILIEEKRLSTTIPTEIIRFLSEDLYTFFIFIQLSDKHQYKLCKGFFEDILSTFSNNPELRLLLLNWSIRFCIVRNQTEALKNIFKLSFSNLEKNSCFTFICDMARYEISKPSSSFNKQSIDSHFVDIMVSGRIMSRSYHDTIKHISNTVLNEDIQVMLHVIECTIYITNMDKLSLYNTMQILKQDYKRLTELFPINPYDLILFFYNSMSNKPVESKSLEEKIIKLCQEINKSLPVKNEEITSAEIIIYRLVLNTLFAQKNYAECHRFIMAILNKHPNIFYLRNSVPSSNLLIILGQTYLKLHYYKKAQRIINFLDKIISSEYTYYTTYIVAYNSLLKANFFNYTGKYQHAMDEISSGLINVSENHFRNLEASFLLLKLDVLKNMDAMEQTPVVIKELLSFLSTHKIALADHLNFNGPEFDHTFKILKSYKQH